LLQHNKYLRNRQRQVSVHRRFHQLVLVLVTAYRRRRVLHLLLRVEVIRRQYRPVEGDLVKA